MGPQSATTAQGKPSGKGAESTSYASILPHVGLFMSNDPLRPLRPTRPQSQCFLAFLSLSLCTPDLSPAVSVPFSFSSCFFFFFLSANFQMRLTSSAFTLSTKLSPFVANSNVHVVFLYTALWYMSVSPSPTAQLFFATAPQTVRNCGRANHSTQRS